MSSGVSGWEKKRVSSVLRRKQELGLASHKPSLHRRQGSSSPESAGLREC